MSFTGGTVTGRDIARKAADKLMAVSLELGGKSPTIVFADADLDLAVAGVMFGVFSSTGQSCIAGSRLFVERSIYDAFVAKLVAATERLRVGHPFEAATQVAPLIRPKHRDEVEGHVARAREDGGTDPDRRRAPRRRRLQGRHVLPADHHCRARERQPPLPR